MNKYSDSASNLIMVQDRFSNSAKQTSSIFFHLFIIAHKSNNEVTVLMHSQKIFVVLRNRVILENLLSDKERTNSRFEKIKS